MAIDALLYGNIFLRTRVSRHSLLDPHNNSMAWWTSNPTWLSSVAWTEIQKLGWRQLFMELFGILLPNLQTGAISIRITGVIGLSMHQDIFNLVSLDHTGGCSGAYHSCQIGNERTHQKQQYYARSSSSAIVTKALGCWYHATFFYICLITSFAL